MSNKNFTLRKDIGTSTSFEDLRYRVAALVAQLQAYLDSNINIHIINSRGAKQITPEVRPTFKTGDLVFDFTVTPGVATMQQWDGKQLIPLGYNSLGAPPTSDGTTGSGGGFLPQVFNEIPLGHIDGINSVYTTRFDFSAGSTRLYLNSARQTLGLDYTESGAKQITFLNVPQPEDEIVIDYNKQ